jgi:hypothetical protein
VASSTNHCGSCSLCCRLLGIKVLEKMPGVWCKFCKPGRGGCTIHNQPEFPGECADYVCLWLQSQHEDAPLPDDLRPDRCHVIIDKRLGENIHNVRCNIGHPHAWKDPRIQKVLQTVVDIERSTAVLVTESGEGQVLYSPHPTLPGVVQRHRR